MNNKALIEKTASATKQSEADVKLIVDAYIANLNMSLQQGTAVTIDDLGSFSVCTRAARTKRDPKTQEMQNIPACKTVKFTLANEFKGRLNEGL